MNFQELAHKLKRHKHPTFLSLDPGGTTGWAYWEEDSLTPARSGQIKADTIKEAVLELNKLLDSPKPIKIIVLEDYKVYAHKLRQHTHSDLHTPRLIGAIETIAAMHDLPIYKQGAHLAKGFCGNPKLKAWNFYQTSNQHRNDAVRHGAYFILFNKALAPKK